MDSETPDDPSDVNEVPETAQLAEAVESIEVAEVADVVEEAEVVEAVEVARYAEPVVGPKGEQFKPVISHQLPPQFQNVAAKGGAVAALVLGCLSVFGAFVTQWSLFNAVIGIMLGLWGLSSNMFRTAVVGIVLCGLGLVLCGAVPTIF